MIIKGELFKQGVCSPLLKCLSRAEGQELMKEIHVGMRSSYWIQAFAWKSFQTRILLAEGSFGCSGPSSKNVKTARVVPEIKNNLRL
jgi:hypothetical protein